MAESPEQALTLAAGESNRTLAQRYLLRMASEFQDNGNHNGARSLLNSDQLAELPPELEKQRRLLAMASAIELDDSAWAEQLTAKTQAEDFLGYPDDLMAKAARLQARTLALAGKELEAATTLILLSQTDRSTSPQQVHDQIWNHLQALNAPALESAAENATGFEIEGWLELALALRTPDATLDDQGRLVRQWQNNWPGHPAAQILPVQLALLAELAATRPENIVLALPFEGRLASAGKAIRDGFLAAYYSDDTTDRKETDIRIVDTTRQPFTELYQELAETRTDLIIGPLEKGQLNDLSAMNTLPVPVLGLNYLSEDSEIPEGLHQFGLSADDEARQIAERLAEERVGKALVLIPYGDWGDRVEDALRERMTELNLTILDIERFMPEDNLRAVTADLLGITASRDRAIQVERTIGLNVEFEPRRRQDAQGIVLVASPTIARQFNPLFAFYYGGDLPVYSPSMIYEGTPDPSRDRDLNRVNFTDIPWVLASELPLREQASEHFSNTSGQLGRLFAMGADAWQIAKRLPLLRQIDSASIDGLTGTLTMNDNGSIHRQQLWAQFRNGEAVLIEDEETSSETSDETTP
ncbi:MAG: penicillin-binding protein activator [Pseudomonadota bacterium]